MEFSFGDGLMRGNSSETKSLGRKDVQPACKSYKGTGEGAELLLAGTLLAQRFDKVGQLSKIRRMKSLMSTFLSIRSFATEKSS